MRRSDGSRKTRCIHNRDDPRGVRHLGSLDRLVKICHLRDVLQLRVVGLRKHEAEELDGGVQVRFVSVPVAGHVALDGFESLMVFVAEFGIEKDQRQQQR